MKQLMSVLGLLVFVTTLSFAQKTDEKSAAPKMEFKTTTVDYGTIEQGAERVRKFAFTNTGKAPLVITGARGSCGCTVPDYPKKPIAPGETAFIEVNYDTNRIGKFSKSVRVTTNEMEMKKTKDENGNIVEKEQAKTHILYIQGDVKAKQAAPAGTPAKEKSVLEK